MDSCDLQGIAYNKGYEAGKNHAEPSPQTKEFMAEIDVKMQTIQDKLDLIPTRDEMKLFVKEAQEEILACADKKYASKITERVVYGMAGAILLYVLTALLSGLGVR